MEDKTSGSTLIITGSRLSLDSPYALCLQTPLTARFTLRFAGMPIFSVYHNVRSTTNSFGRTLFNVPFAAITFALHLIEFLVHLIHSYYGVVSQRLLK